MKIDKAIRLYADFLNKSWDTVYHMLVNRDYTSDEDSVNDWLQANWELLVERSVLLIDDYLEVYGEGADFNGASSRITDPKAIPNYRVVLAPPGKPVFDLLNNETIEFRTAVLDKLVGFKDGFYSTGPEFNFVLFWDEDKKLERVIKLEDVIFDIEKL